MSNNRGRGVSIDMDASNRLAQTEDGEVLRRLAWGETHNEPAWVYSDGSKGCWWEATIGAGSDDHSIVAGPWETGA